MIRRRSAIEPAIGHVKTNGKLDWNWLKGASDDAIQAVLCGAGYNIGMTLRKLRFYCVLALIALLTCTIAASSAVWLERSTKRIVQGATQ
jgi:IS5 family transposase